MAKVEIAHRQPLLKNPWEKQLNLFTSNAIHSSEVIVSTTVRPVAGTSGHTQRRTVFLEYKTAGPTRERVTLILLSRWKFVKMSR